MRVRMFKNQFYLKILGGDKRQTIRPAPKRMPKVGDKESWRQWSGLPYRSPQIELAQVELTSVQIIKMKDLGREDIVVIDGRLLPIEECHALAVADGFKDFIEMATWFFGHYGSKFEGILIRAK